MPRLYVLYAHEMLLEDKVIYIDVHYTRFGDRIVLNVIDILDDEDCVLRERPQSLLEKVWDRADDIIAHLETL